MYVRPMASEDATIDMNQLHIAKQMLRAISQNPLSRSAAVKNERGSVRHDASIMQRLPES